MDTIRPHHAGGSDLGSVEGPDVALDMNHRK